MISDKICLIDVDGTLADYDGSMKEELIKINPPNFVIPDNLHNTDKYLENQMDLIKSIPGFWSNLKPLKIGFEILEMVKNIGFTIMILSKGPGKCVSAWSEKMEWCQKYCPDVGVTLTHAREPNKHKGLVYGRVLVDDYPPYILQWLEWRPRGLVIMPTAKINESFKHPNVIRYDDDAKEITYSELVLAFNR